MEEYLKQPISNAKEDSHSPKNEGEENSEFGIL
jgi:hypothetical protein